jgi:hypothetical protein
MRLKKYRKSDIWGFNWAGSLVPSASDLALLGRTAANFPLNYSLSREELI